MLRTHCKHTAGPDALERESAPGPVDVEREERRESFMDAGLLLLQ